MLVQEFSQLPDNILQLPAQALHEVLGGPSLIVLPGRLPSALLVSVLMHGNETTGWDALREVLLHYSCAGGERELPRALYIFIANTSAAAQGLRHLPDQPDYNRVWPGLALPACAESGMMQALVDKLRTLDLFASVDIHNNTGLNPHYACVNHLDNQSLHLAAMFCRTVVYFTTPQGLQSQAMAALCPAVTLECGLVGESRGIEHAAEFIEACLHLSEHPTQQIASRDIDLFHTTGVVHTVAGLHFDYAAHARDLELYKDIEYYNFRELPAGTPFGRVKNDALPFLVKNELGEDVSASYFALRNGEVVTRKRLMPSMLTRDVAIIEQDCFCYLMERYPLEVQS